MARIKGTFEMSSNVEPRLAAPFDARTVVPTKADLTDPTNFQFSYVGMIVSVQSEGVAYMLTADDPTALGNWKMVGEGITPTITVDDAMSTTSENPVQNKVITAALADKVDATDLNDYYDKTEIDTLLDTKQDELVAGNNITLVADPYTNTTLISADDPDLTNYYNKTEADDLIAAEETARSDADAQLQYNIDQVADDLEELKNSPDVVDIVHTYADLQAYDTSTLGEDDIIRVLNDETHDGASAYYKWANNAWTFIGITGPYYTKLETDTLLDTKQDELTAGNNITIITDPYTNTAVISAADPDLTNYYDKTETDTLLADKADKTDLNDYATKTELQTGLDTKQDELTAGKNITIVTDPYTNTAVISADDPDLSDYATKTDLSTGLDTKQNELTAGTNISIVEDPYTNTTIISATGGSDGKVGEDFTTNIEVGGLASGTAIDKDDTITSVLKRMLVTTYYPTYTAPSVTLNYSGATLLKVGASISATTVTEVFNAGAIMLEGVKQNDRAGAATSYTLATTGATTDFNDTNTTGSFSVPALTRSTKGNIVATATVAHEAGPQPKDSDGNDYGSPLPAGSVTASKTFEFILPFYHGVANSNTISDFTGLTEDLSKKGQKQYTYTTNNQHMVIAYDATYGNLTSILDPNNFETINSWNKSTLTVDGQNYNVYVAATPSTNPSAKYTFKF